MFTFSLGKTSSDPPHSYYLDTVYHATKPDAHSRYYASKFNITKYRFKTMFKLKNTDREYCVQCSSTLNKLHTQYASDKSSFIDCTVNLTKQKLIIVSRVGM